MRYLLLLHADEDAIAALSPAERLQIVQAHLDFRARASDAGVLDGGEALADSAEVQSVRSADGLVTDGPFIEAKEGIGGYYVISCSRRDQALDWARQVPAAPGQVVEVRPILEV